MFHIEETDKIIIGSSGIALPVVIQCILCDWQDCPAVLNNPQQHATTQFMPINYSVDHQTQMLGFKCYVAWVSVGCTTVLTTTVIQRHCA